jgi:hypothetical protein
MHNLPMRLIYLAFALLVLPTVLQAAPPAKAPTWNTSIMQARHAAEMSGKPLVIFFGGTGWNAASDTFLKNFTNDPGFASLADRAVLLRIDMPSASKTPVTELEIQTNNIAVFCRIDTVPTIVICNLNYETKLKLPINGASAAFVMGKLDTLLPY